MARSNDRTPIGLDVCEKGAKLLQLERRGDAWAASAAASFELPQQYAALEADYQAAFSDGLKHALSSTRFHGTAAVATLPPGVVDVRTLTLPGREDETQKMLRWEAESYLSYDIKDAVIDYVVLGQATAGNERRTEVLVISVRRDAVEVFLEMTRRCGLHVKAVEVVPTALCRLVCHRRGVTRDCKAIAVVDVGRATTTAVVMNSGELRLSRQILQGGARLTKLIAKGLEIADADAEVLKCQHGLGLDAPQTALAEGDELLSGLPLVEPAAEQTMVVPAAKVAAIVRDLVRPSAEQFADEIQKLLRYFAMQVKGEAVSQVILTGGGSLLKGLDTFLGGHLGLGVTVVSSVSKLLGAEPAADDPPSFAVAAGLALRG